MRLEWKSEEASGMLRGKPVCLNHEGCRLVCEIPQGLSVGGWPRTGSQRALKTCVCRLVQWPCSWTFAAEELVGTVGQRRGVIGARDAMMMLREVQERNPSRLI